jgi:hypothetical protein
MRTPFATPDGRRLLAQALQAAPSIFNTQPWQLQVRSDNCLELEADVTRHLSFVDPWQRELIISCGAALFNLRMAIQAAGWEPEVWLFPHRTWPLLARVEITEEGERPPSRAERELSDAISKRHTNRESFSSWRRVKRRDIAKLQSEALQEKAFLTRLNRAEAGQLLRDTAKADRELGNYSYYHRELTKWTAVNGASYGVPTEAFGPLPQKHRLSKAPAPIRDFRWPPGEDGPENTDHSRDRQRFERHPRLLVLYTEDDGPLNRMRAGQALQRVLLRATHLGLAASFLTQPLEKYDNRMRYDHASACPPPFTHAQMIIRVGHSRHTVQTPPPRAPWTSVFPEPTHHGSSGC